MNSAYKFHHQRDIDAPEEAGRIAATSKFKIEEFQYLSKNELLIAQVIAGHGDEWGVWTTSKSICPSKLVGSLRKIDLSKRINHFIEISLPPENLRHLIKELLEEGVVTLIRLALILRLAPTGGKKNKKHRLKPSSVAANLYSYYPSIVAKAILNKAAHPEGKGLLNLFTENDLQDIRNRQRFRIAIDRLRAMAECGWWSDFPPHADTTLITNPSGPKTKNVPQIIQRGHLPLSNEYLEEFGPRNLWVIVELGMV